MFNIGYNAFVFVVKIQIISQCTLSSCKSKSMDFSSKNHDVGRMGRYTQNLLQWNRNDIKSTRMANGDYSWQSVLKVYEKA